MCKKIIAITGPSGSGKTTMTKLISKNYNIKVPEHVTTRKPRSDDEVGFYKYVSIDEFNGLIRERKFLIASGEGTNFYGVLKQDCEDAWQLSNSIILNVSYKDLDQLKNLSCTYRIKVNLVVLTFKDIAKGVQSRLILSNRLSSDCDIKHRIDSALKDFEKYFTPVESFASLIVYTETISETETYDLIVEKLGLKQELTLSRGKPKSIAEFNLEKGEY